MKREEGCTHPREHPAGVTLGIHPRATRGSLPWVALVGAAYGCHLRDGIAPPWYFDYVDSV